MPLAVLFFALSCSKAEMLPPPSIPEEIPSCIIAKENPAGRNYESVDLLNYTCTKNFCGFLPLSTGNYWVYEDSVFDNGVFRNVQMDTLRFTKTMRSSSDSLTWWEADLSVGMPKTLYSTDSALFALEQRIFDPAFHDAKKDLSLFTGDSARYLTGFDDIAAQGRSVKLNNSILTGAGIFEQCILFEKNARNYRKDQIIFKPGVGVLKYIHEKAAFGQRDIRLQNILTLVAFHIE